MIAEETSGRKSLLERVLQFLARPAIGADTCMIDRGQVRKRKKKPSKKFRDAFGHTPRTARTSTASFETPRARARSGNSTRSM
jgi:hypothetical protein